MRTSCYRPADLVEAGFMEKTRELDDQKSGEVQHWRKRFTASLQNERLHEAGIAASVDHRSHAECGLLDMPGSHHGPAVNEICARAAAQTWLIAWPPRRQRSSPPGAGRSGNG